MSESSGIPTKVVAPADVVQLRHRVGDVTTSMCGQHLAAYSRDGYTVTALSGDGTRREVQLDEPLECLCLSVDSTGNLLASARSEEDHITVCHLDSGQREKVQCRSEVVSVRFDDQGRLWTVRWGTNRLVVELLAPDGWQLMGEAEFGDDYFTEGADIRLGPSGGSVFLSAYSGQSEQQHHLCEVLDGVIVPRHVSEMDGDQHVFAAPQGHILTLDHWDSEIVLYDDTFGSPTARLPWPDFDEDTNPDERPGYYGCYVDDSRFLAGSSEGRLFVIELQPFRILREIHVQGFAPVPTSVKYPTLSDAAGFCSDLLLFGSCGDLVAGFFAKSHHSSSPQLVLLQTNDLID